MRQCPVTGPVTGPVTSPVAARAVSHLKPVSGRGCASATPSIPERSVRGLAQMDLGSHYWFAGAKLAPRGMVRAGDVVRPIQPTLAQGHGATDSGEDRVYGRHQAGWKKSGDHNRDRCRDQRIFDQVLSRFVPPQVKN